MNPCCDYCYIRLGKQYTSECDDTCDYAKEVKKRKDLLESIRLDLIDLAAQEVIDVEKKQFSEIGEGILMAVDIVEEYMVANYIKGGLE